MLTFEATPQRVTEATKLSYQLGVSIRGLDSYWAAQPRVTQIAGFGFTLKPYQADGVAHLERWNGNVLLADAPGLGKTAQVMAYAFKNHRFPMLAVMPKTLLLNWQREITRMLGRQLTILVVGIMPSKRRQAVLKQQNPHVSFAKMVEPGYDITLINYDLAQRNLSRLEQVAYAYAVFDESHKIKNYQAQRTQALVQLATGVVQLTNNNTNTPPKKTKAGISSVTFCSGTPFVNRPSELWSTVGTIAAWVPQFGNFFSYAQQFCGAHKTRWGWDFSGSSNLAELNQLLLSTVMIRRLKEDVLPELPAKTFCTVPLEFDRRAYDAVAGAFEGTAAWEQGMAALVQHGGKPTRSNEAIVAINKCREIAALSKLDAAVEWIVDFLENGEKLVVFAHHQHMVDHVVKAMEDASIGVRKIRGGVSAEQRDAAAHDFQTDPNVRVIVLNITSAGFGITLTAARSCVFLQLPWSAADLMQAADRIHRIGQSDNVTVYNLVAENTVEERLADMIISKAEDFNQAIDGGGNQELAALNLSR
jgi:SWI/SNF-related matrix-associated actin-dependent regulator of chromatin subfamily A-like protein 1